MEILKSMISAVGSLKKVYLSLGLGLLPVLSFADAGDFSAAATHMSAEASDGKILVFNILLALGAMLIMAGIVTVLKKHVEHKWTKVATMIILGSLCLSPKAVVTFANTSTIGGAGDSTSNMTQQFSAS